MSAPDSTETVDTVEITYPGPHHKVYVPGTSDIATAGEPVKVERGLAQRLVNEGWASDTLAAETPTPADEPAETADAPPQGTPAPEEPPAETAVPPAADETATDTSVTTGPRRRP
jgi:hypothetical protein